MNRFKQTVDTELHSIRMTPKMMESLEEEKRMMKKRPFVTILVCVLVLVAVTAAAITVSEIIKQKMEPVVEMQLTSAWNSWNLQVKAGLIDRMQNWGLEMDEQKLRAVRDERLDESTREQAADEIIFAVFTKEELETIRTEHPDVEQQEDYPIPSNYTIFKVLWLKEAPGSDENEILAAYNEWEKELTDKVNGQASTVTYASCEENVRELFELNMSEVLSMSTRERASAEIDIAPVEGYPLWQATMNVSGKNLRDSTKATLNAGSELSPEIYDVSTDTYTYVTLFEETESGLTRVSDARSVEEYEYARLNESVMWPESEEDVHGYYHRFLTATAADKAAFTAKYKPIAEQWYTEHADFAAKLGTAFENGTKLDTLYMVTRHSYGMPTDGMMKEDEIRSLAADFYAKVCGKASVDELLGDRFEMYVWYDVTDEANPIWKVTVKSNVDTNPTGYMNYETRHMVFATDGTLQRDGGEPLWIAGEETPAAPSVSAPLIDSDSIEFR